MGYVVIGLDDEGYEVSGGMEWDTERDARQYAKRLAADKEAIAAGMVKVEMRNAGECVRDYFVN